MAASSTAAVLPPGGVAVRLAALLLVVVMRPAFCFERHFRTGRSAALGLDPYPLAHQLITDGIERKDQVSGFVRPLAGALQQLAVCQVVRLDPLKQQN